MELPPVTLAFTFIWGWPYMVAYLAVALCICAIPIWVMWSFLQSDLDKNKSRAIQKSFQEAGNLRGKTFDEIVAIGGQPIHCFDYPDGKRVGIFGHTRYRVVLIFRGGLCEGVNTEITS